MSQNQVSYTWPQRFCSRRCEVYHAEDRKLCPDLGRQSDAQGQEIVHELLNAFRDTLHPKQYNSAALERFLRRASLADLVKGSSADSREVSILLDDQQNSADGPPPDSALRSKWYDGNFQGAAPRYEHLDPYRLQQRLIEPRQERKVERRVIYLANLKPAGALALVVNVAGRHATFLRDFLHRHVVNRALFTAQTMTFGYAFEFHFPAYAMRKDEPGRDLKDPRGIRHHRRIAALMNQRQPDSVYQSQTSLLIVGVDDWFWTAYFCVDSYFGSEASVDVYCTHEVDGPNGGRGLMESPILNPREYFVTVAANRLDQVTLEWRNIAYEFEDRLDHYEESFFDASSVRLDSRKTVQKSKEHKETTQLLRHFSNCLTNLIEAWEQFEQSELQIFLLQQSQLEERWEHRIFSIKKNIEELKYCRRWFERRTEVFERLRDDLMNELALGEAISATEQGKDIGLLTIITIFYLPPSLIAGIYSTVMFSGGGSWLVFGVLVGALTSLTVFMIAIKAKLPGSLDKMSTLLERLTQIRAQKRNSEKQSV